METEVQEIVKEVVQEKQSLPKESEKDPQIKNPSARKSDQEGQDKSIQSGDVFSAIRKEIFACPFMNLFEQYAISQNFARCSKERCIYNYRLAHPIRNLLSYWLDFIARFIFIASLFYVFFKGVGIIKV